MMNKVVSLNNAREKMLANGSSAQQAYALVGPTPMMTLQAGEAGDDVCCCIRMRATASGSWIGLVNDHSVFSDRIRMGLTPTFTVYPQAFVATVCGDASVRLMGRADDLDKLDESVREAADLLLREQPFALRDAVVVEVTPASVRVVDEDANAVGGIPRT